MKEGSGMKVASGRGNKTQEKTAKVKGHFWTTIKT